MNDQKQDVLKKIEELSLQIEEKRNLFQSYQSNGSTAGIPDSSSSVVEKIELEIDELQRRVLQLRSIL